MERRSSRPVYSGAGQPFVIVGGHAANFWAEFYSEREPRLKASLPFTSKDLDVIGAESDARRVAKALGWHLSPAPVGGGPVQAVLNSEPEGAGLAVEFLSEIKGVSHQTIIENVREGVVSVPTTGQTVTVRVLDPVLLLAGKIPYSGRSRACQVVCTKFWRAAAAFCDQMFIGDAFIRRASPGLESSRVTG